MRYQSDLSYREKIEQLVSQNSERLHYVPIISRESVFGILSGRIPKLLNSKQLQQQVGLPNFDTTNFFYICGNPEMVKDTGLSLNNLGYTKHLRSKTGQFSSENYW